MKERVNYAQFGIFSTYPQVRCMVAVDGKMLPTAGVMWAGIISLCLHAMQVVPTQFPVAKCAES